MGAFFHAYGWNFHCGCVILFDYRDKSEGELVLVVLVTNQTVLNSLQEKSEMIEKGKTFVDNK